MDMIVAIAFDKPIFVLHDGLRPKDIPEFLREFQLFPLSRLGSVANQISALKELPEAISG